MKFRNMGIALLFLILFSCSCAGQKVTSASDNVSSVSIASSMVESNIESSSVVFSSALETKPVSSENGAEGVGSDFLDTSPRQIYYVVAEVGLNFRTEASVDSEIITLIPYGDFVTSLPITSENHGEWLYVKYLSLEGWVNREYISTTPPLEITPITANYTPKLSTSFYMKMVYDIADFGLQIGNEEEIWNYNAVRQLIWLEGYALEDGYPSRYNLVQYGKQSWFQQFKKDGKYPSQFSAFEHLKDTDGKEGGFIIPADIFTHAIYSWFGVLVDVTKMEKQPYWFYDSEYDVVCLHISLVQDNRWYKIENPRITSVINYDVTFKFDFYSFSPGTSPGPTPDETPAIVLRENPNQTYRIISI